MRIWFHQLIHSLSITTHFISRSLRLDPFSHRPRTFKSVLLNLQMLFPCYPRRCPCMSIYFPCYDISYLVATISIFSSALWCIHACFVWLPPRLPSSEYSGEIAGAGGITAFLRATVFEFGSVQLMLEAVNEHRMDCLGWAVEEVWEEEETGRRSHHPHPHPHLNRRNSIGRSVEIRGEEMRRKVCELLLISLSNLIQKMLIITANSLSSPTFPPPHSWQWYPSLSALSTHYLHSLGFLGCSSQMFGATIFWISGFTALPPLYTHLSSTLAQNVACWLPQVIDGMSFIICGIPFMLETQRKCYVPALSSLGWHTAARNLLGGIGFTLYGALGSASENSAALYQRSLATFWRSGYFSIGSVVQWYESLEKISVEEEGGGGENVKLGACGLMILGDDVKNMN
ncbi:hypothetical protein H4I96_05487 [Botrytis cinerea]